MNRERLQMVRDRIASEPPERLNMIDYTCGTAHCIAGWSWIVEGRPRHEDHGYKLDDSSTTRFLELTYDQDRKLCYPTGYSRQGAYIRDDALAALDSLIKADSDDALPVWPEPRT